jgi:copper chaperone NosL
MIRGELRRSLSRALTSVAAAVVLVACSKPAEVSQPPLVIRSGDVCVVCGMYIDGQPGPRGEAYVDGDGGVLKFGSTRDFFAYVTRADIGSRLESAYVQDAAHIVWAHPSDAADSFVDARKAYYVAWQPLPGEMGPTFASFANRADAETFVRRDGGAILRFEQITAALVSGLDYRCPGPKSPFFELSTRSHCVIVPDAQGRIRTFR